MDGRGRVGRSAEVADAGAADPLPTLAIALGHGEHLVEVAGQGGDHDQPSGSDMGLLAVKREVTATLGQHAGGPQVTCGDRGLGRHVRPVGELEPGISRHRHPGQQLGTPRRAGHRSADLTQNKVYGRELVQRRALGQRVAHAVG
jgi:hypothetical protein